MMFTLILRCVSLGRSQTSQATPSPTQFYSLCIGGSDRGSGEVEPPECMSVFRVAVIGGQPSLLKHLIGQHNDSANVLVNNSTCVRHLPKRKFKFTEGESVHPVQFEEHDLQGFTFVLEINICPK